MNGMHAGALTISDGVAAGTRQDKSGDVLYDCLTALGLSVDRATVADDQVAIAEAIRDWSGRCRLVVTTGGTGFGPRDVTPEATSRLIERPAPGISELLRATGMQHTPMAALSRGVAGVIGDCLVVNLPGSPKAVSEGMEVLGPLLPHVVRLLGGDTKH